MDWLKDSGMKVNESKPSSIKVYVAFVTLS